jgi:antitoxin VapB
MLVALTIEHPEVDRLARELAATIGESLTEVILQALRERLIREQGRKRMLHLNLVTVPL